MSIRIRKNGRMFCAAINPEEEGDMYIDDGLHYYLSVEKRVIVTTENDHHMSTGGEWWWRGQEPKGTILGKNYTKPPAPPHLKEHHSRL